MKMDFNWDAIIPAVVALCGALAAIFGSHKRINNNMLSFLDDLIGKKVQMEKLVEELTKLRDELKRED
jgi:hypothetical protein